MIVRGSQWGPVIGTFYRRRPDGLSKTMAASLILHFLFFSLVILSQVLSNLNKPNYQSFQVNLVTSGSGLTPPKPVAQKRVASPSEKKPAQVNKTLIENNKSPTPSKKVPPPIPLKTKMAPTNTPAPLVQPPAPKKKAPVTAPSPVQDDPDRLEEWWKKQSKIMKTPTEKTAKKQDKIISPKRRTAKIDIMRKSIVVPPVTPSPKIKIKPSISSTSQPVSPVPSEVNKADVESREAKTHPTEALPTPTEGTGEAIPDAETPTETASLGPRGKDGRIESTGGASTGNVHFAFPGYLQRIDTKIRWQWAPPPITPEKDSLVVRFDINKNGSIDKMSVVVKESSGNTFFDQAALRAVYAAHPFPPLPDAYNDRILTVYMHFIVQEAS